MNDDNVTVPRDLLIRAMAKLAALADHSEKHNAEYKHVTPEGTISDAREVITALWKLLKP